MKPSRAGVLTGLEDVHVGRNLELVPFVGGANRSGGRQPQLNKFTANGGLNARYGLQQNLTANLAINPDFGETEADQFTAEVSRFEIFFPEKRQFFTEGANYFQTPLNLFFSRRIGSPMPDGEPQRILEGGKITGKIRRLDHRRAGGRHAVAGLRRSRNPNPAAGAGRVFRRGAPAARSISEVRLRLHDREPPPASGQRRPEREHARRGPQHPLRLAYSLGFAGHGQHQRPPIPAWTRSTSDGFRISSTTPTSSPTRPPANFSGNKVDLSHTGFEPADRPLERPDDRHLEAVHQPRRHPPAFLQPQLRPEQRHPRRTGRLRRRFRFQGASSRISGWRTSAAPTTALASSSSRPISSACPNTRGYQEPIYIVELTSNQSRRVYFDVAFPDAEDGAVQRELLRLT